MRRAGQIALSVTVSLLVWQALVSLTGLPRFILPGPAEVGRTLWASRALIAHHGSITLAEVLLGLGLGTALGAASAIGLAASPVLSRQLRPMLVFSQAIPVFALAPILTLWLGYGIGSKIVMTVLIIYFPVTSAFFDGLTRTPPGLLDLAHVMRGRPGRIMWLIRIPAALPGLASGLRLSAVYAPVGAVIGEWVGASGGLGYLMLLANGRAKTDLMFAALIVLALMAVLLHMAVDRACRHLIDRRF